MGFGLFLMDSPMNSIYKMDQKKRISLSRIDRVFRVGMISILDGSIGNSGIHMQDNFFFLNHPSSPFEA